MIKRLFPDTFNRISDDDAFKRITPVKRKLINFICASVIIVRQCQCGAVSGVSEKINRITVPVEQTTVPSVDRAFFSGSDVQSVISDTTEVVIVDALFNLQRTVVDDLHQFFAFRKRVIADVRNLPADRHADKVCTGCKGVFPDIGHAVRKNNVRKQSTFAKRIRTDGCHTVSDDKCFHAFAFGKCPVADFRHFLTVIIIWQDHFGEIYPFRNPVGIVLRQFHSGDRCTINFYIINGVFISCFFLLTSRQAQLYRFYRYDRVL